MSISLTEDFKTLAELQDHTADILKQVQQTGRPVAITINGKPAAVLMEADQYEWLLHLLNLSRMLHQAEADVRAGRVQPLEEFLEELDREQKTSGRRRRTRQN